MKCEECQYMGKCKEKAKEPNLLRCTSGIPVEKMGIRTNGTQSGQWITRNWRSFSQNNSTMESEKISLWNGWKAR